MSYGKVHDAFWDSERIDGISDRAALLALFLLTGPHRNAIGCFKLGTGAITDVERFGKWGTEGVSNALRELSDAGFIVRDDRSGWTFIINALKHDPIKGRKAAVHALGLLQRVPTNCDVYQALIGRLEPQLEDHSDDLSGKDGWPIEAPSDTLSKGDDIPQRSPEPLPEPIPEPEPTPPKSPPPKAGGTYAFVGKVVRLTAEDLDGWKKSFSYLDVPAELTGLDPWLDENSTPQQRKNWFPRVAAILAKKNRDIAGKHKAEAAQAAEPESPASHLTDEQKLQQENYIRGVQGKPPRLPDGTIDWDAPPVDSMPDFLKRKAG